MRHSTTAAVYRTDRVRGAKRVKIASSVVHIHSGTRVNLLTTDKFRENYCTGVVGCRVNDRRTSALCRPARSAGVSAQCRAADGVESLRNRHMQVTRVTAEHTSTRFRGANYSNPSWNRYDRVVCGSDVSHAKAINPIGRFGIKANRNKRHVIERGSVEIE